MKKETNQRKIKTITEQEETENNSLSVNREAIPDGVYFITGKLLANGRQVNNAKTPQNATKSRRLRHPLR